MAGDVIAMLLLLPAFDMPRRVLCPSRHLTHKIPNITTAALELHFAPTFYKQNWGPCPRPGVLIQVQSLLWHLACSILVLFLLITLNTQLLYTIYGFAPDFYTVHGLVLSR